MTVFYFSLLFGDKRFQNLPLMIDGAPKVVLDAVDHHKDLIEAPLSLYVLTDVRRPPGTDIPREDWTEMIDPKPHALMPDIDASLMKEVFDIPQRKWEPDIHCNRELDELR